MSRIQELIDRTEAGEPITNKTLARLKVWQALDVARAGEVFVQESIEREREADA